MSLLNISRPNDQKLFYSLLLKYRDDQLENYTLDIGYSTSDYHHVRPLAMTKTYSTRHFPQPKGRGHGRQISRFTVISNVAETEQSYDPFKASRPQHLDAQRASDRARVTIHRMGSGATQTTVLSRGAITKTRQSSHTPVSVTSGSNRGNRSKHIQTRMYTSRSSLASSSRSRYSASHMRAPVGHKRGVSFSHIRKPSGGSNRFPLGNLPEPLERHSNNTEVTDDGASHLRVLVDTPASTRYIRSRKAQMIISHSLIPPAKTGRQSQLWTEDVRQLSSSLAKDCDEAFNRSTLSSVDAKSRDDTPQSSLQQCQLAKDSSSILPQPRSLAAKKSKHSSWDSRPLPPPPERSDSVRIELLEARKNAELRMISGGDDPSGYLDRMVSHIDRLIQPTSPISIHVNRRTFSAPVDTKRITANRPLPSIFEAHKEEDSPKRGMEFHKLIDRQLQVEAKNGRTASAPEARVLQKNNPNDRSGAYSNDKPTIRVVQPSSPLSPVKVPAPLTIRKKNSQVDPRTTFGKPDTATHANRQRHSVLEFGKQHSLESKLELAPELSCVDEGHNNDDFANDSNCGTIVKKKTTWFRRNSKTGDDQDWRMSIGGINALPSQSSSTGTVRPEAEAPLPLLPRKKFSFGRLFRKRSSQPDMSVGSK